MINEQALGGEVFDLNDFFFGLVQFGARQLGNAGCYKSNECAEDVASIYVFDDELRGPGRCEILEDKIRINFPDALNQKSVLYAMLKYEIMNKKSRCKDCKFRTVCPIAEDSETNEDDRRRDAEVLVSPATPEDLFLVRELRDLCLNALEPAARRDAFELFLYGYSHKEIADRLNVTPERVRQWHSRDFARFRFLLSGEAQSQTPDPADEVQEAPNKRKRRRADIISKIRARVSLPFTYTNPAKSKH